MDILTGYLGTYASSESLGIYRFTIDLRNGALSYPELYYKAPDCKYLSLDGTLLAAPQKRDGRAGICILDTDGDQKKDMPVVIGEEFKETSPACYVVQDGNYLYTANYHEGSVLVYEKLPHELRMVKGIEMGCKAGCHQILFYSHYMLVPCLLLDAVKIFDCHKDFALVSQLGFHKGTGPRHGVFDKDHSRLFLVSELSNQIFVYKTDHRLDDLQNVYPILPEGTACDQPPASAAIRLSPDERFLYVSTRFADLITVLEIDGCFLKPVQQTNCGGVHPRDILLTPDGNFLLAVNRTRGGLVSFRLDPESGRLSELCCRVPAPEAVSIVLGDYVR